MSNSNRKLMKTVQETEKKVEGMMTSPCTISEAVQIARGVAEDTVNDYHRDQSHFHLSMSIQLELLKELVIKAGLITEEEFRQKYIDKSKELMELQEKMKSQRDGVTSMTGTVNEVEIIKE